MFKTKTKAKADFIKNAVAIHGEKYDYSLVNYMGSLLKVKIICKKHGVFEQRPGNHINLKNGCPKCKKDRLSDIFKKPFDVFVEQASFLHKNKYNYLITNYKDAHTKIEICCPTHGIFKQTPHNHLHGNGCGKCAESIRKTKEEFVVKSIKIHGNLYDYSLVEYTNSLTKVKIICNIHGLFLQSPSNHSNHMRGCPKCKYSKGERAIEQFLIVRDISYIPQFKFEDLSKLKFDFYLPELNTLIEYDGEQHTIFPNQFHRDISDFRRQQKRDELKNEYARERNIILIRIPFFEFKNINFILEENLHGLYQ